MNPGQARIREAGHRYKGRVSNLVLMLLHCRQCYLAPPPLCFVELVVCLGVCYGRCVNVLILSFLVWGNDTVSNNGCHLLGACHVPCTLNFIHNVLG